ncbi:rifamycin-inactivating phosphotransferase [Amycolatopsis sp. DSM 110486]|uniref:rifamycin-inactivating phosphotransferase n=1 Tax=Amycolatopsis sp. DSM 110486 TaxID=2865832 RepID=UPI0021028B3F|nr:rifamycin-inactivating phosphotransferase [Amycolatopsis sp. DSM 110486]
MSGTELVLDFREIDRDQIDLVGGKGAHLGELSRIDGVRVPPGYCVTTHAFRRVLAGVPELGSGLDRLARLDPDDRETIAALSGQVREAVSAAAIPDDLAAALLAPLSRLDESAAYAVRSSATAEDLPTASFAGQQDTYLNVVGPAAILEHIRLCWASLFTDRAVTYRLRNGFDHRRVHMAVVVQRMVLSEASGILFTADPITSNRKVTTVDAGFGLGEALVSGLVNADSYRVREGEIVKKTVSAKQLAIHALPGGGTRKDALAPEDQERPALTDEQVLQLERLGRRIEAHFGRPQDIEWCLADSELQIVQSRPITTLFPIPPAADDGNHVYLSVGHQQMMTDAMRPLGLSVWQLTTPRPMAEAGSRLFVDATPGLATKAGRAGYLEMMGASDPLMRDALQTVLDRGFLPEPTEGGAAPLPFGVAPEPIETDPAIVRGLIAESTASLAALEREIREKRGAELFDFILADLQELRRLLFNPRSHQAIMAGMDATTWLNKQLREWLGEENAADTLSQSAPDNVSSEMGLALLDVADVLRPHPEVVTFLRTVRDESFLDELPALPGGSEARKAIQGYLDTYGMRCVGEIDIARPRWSERPSTLLPVLLGNVDNFEPGAARRRFDQGLREAAQKEQELLSRLRVLPDGARKAEETKAMIDRLRTFVGYREYPKYGMISRYFQYKKALLAEAERLVAAGVLDAPEDSFSLRFQELHEVARTGVADADLIRRRKEQFAADQALTPQRVLTSEGETVSGSYRPSDAPAGALPGLPVSAGTVEGRARVVLDLSEADLDTADILVTAYTDPSWSPVFVTIAGLITEVGGLMTHGAVVAREYGLPAVVGVNQATRLIRDGQRIRVNGTNGYVEFLD